jgi:hypothetical protein
MIRFFQPRVIQTCHFFETLKHLTTVYVAKPGGWLTISDNDQLAQS